LFDDKKEQKGEGKEKEDRPLRGASIPPGAVTWTHAGGGRSRLPTPLAVTLCYRDGRHGETRKKGKHRR